MIKLQGFKYDILKKIASINRLIISGKILFILNIFIITENINSQSEHVKWPAFDQSMQQTTDYILDQALTNKDFTSARNLYDTFWMKNTDWNETPRIPKIIHHIWIGSPPPDRIKPFIESWKIHHPDWTYYLWTDIDIENFGLINKEAYAAATNWGEKLRYCAL